MSEQVEATPEETQVAEMANLVTEIRNEAKTTAVETAKTLLRKVLSGTPKSAVTEAVAEQSDDTTRENRGTDRLQPHDLADARYEALPPRYRFRSAAKDLVCQRFLRALRDKDHVTLRELQADSQRAALAIGDIGANFGISDGTAAQLVPLELSSYIQTVLHRSARMRAWARVFTAGMGDNLRIPIQDADAGTTWAAESSTGTGQEPTVADGVKLDLVKLRNVSLATDELLESSAFNVGAWLTQQVGEKMAAVEDEAMYSSGTGPDTQPNGFELSDVIDNTLATNPLYVIPGAEQGATTATDPLVFSLAGNEGHLAKMFFALPEQARRNAIWSGGDQVMQALTGIVDGNGRQILNLQNNPTEIVGDQLAGGSIGSIYGRPVVNLPGKQAGTPAVPDVDGTENRLYFGDPSRYYAILERGQITAAASTDFLFTSDTTTFKFVRKVDGKPIGNRTVGLPFDYVFSASIAA